MIGRWQQFAATGDISTAQVILRAVVLSPAAAAASAVIREGGSGGTVVLTLQGAANGSASVVDAPAAIRAPHLTLSGAGATVSVLI